MKRASATGSVAEMSRLSQAPSHSKLEENLKVLKLILPVECQWHASAVPLAVPVVHWQTQAVSGATEGQCPPPHMTQSLTRYAIYESLRSGYSTAGELCVSSWVILLVIMHLYLTSATLWLDGSTARAHQSN